MVIMNKYELYDLKLSDDADAVLQLLLRSYTGLFADYVQIWEEQLAYTLGISFERVYNAMLELGRQHALHYVPRRSTPYIYYTTSRELPKHVVLPRSVYEDFRERMERRVEAMKRFIFDETGCRVRGMLAYFGQTEAADCGKCDYCRSRQPREKINPEVAERREKAILRLIGKGGAMSLEQLAASLNATPSEIIPAVRRLADEGDLRLDGLTVMPA